MFKFFKANHWHYKNTFLLIISIIIFIFLADTPFVRSSTANIGDWGYFGAVIMGILSVMTFTAAPALLILYDLSEKLNIYELSLLAGFGSVLGDFIVFSFFKDKVFTELQPIIQKIIRKPFMHIFRTHYFAWLTPVVGALIIASPLPDDMGVPLLSASKIKKWQFVILSFVLNSLGVWLLLNAIHLIAE
jgi:hypothetical protein